VKETEPNTFVGMEANKWIRFIMENELIWEDVEM
jgi:hypothetical protein